MKKNSQGFLLSFALISTLTFQVSAYAESNEDSNEEEQASSLYDRAFPETYNTAGGYAGAFGQVTITSVAAGFRGIVNEAMENDGTLTPAKKAMRNFLNQETRRLAIEDLKASNESLHQLILNQEQAQENLDKARSTVKEIDEFKLNSAIDIDKTLGKTGEVTYRELVNARAQAQLNIPDLERALVAAQKAAIPAEEQILKIKDTMIATIKKGNSPEYRKLLARVRWRNFNNGFLLANYVSAAWRVVNAWNGRQSGVSPAYSLGSESVKSVWQGLKSVKVSTLKFNATDEGSNESSPAAQVANGN